VGLNCLCTMVTKATMVTKMFAEGKNRSKCIVGFRYEGPVDIFKPLNIKLSSVNRMK
jgi:hypothetical protein